MGLIDVDSHNFPNLCLMKLSAYHKLKGDIVEWYDSRRWYDIVYMSRVFTDSYSKDFTGTIHTDQIIRCKFISLSRLGRSIEATCRKWCICRFYPRT